MVIIEPVKAWVSQCYILAAANCVKRSTLSRPPLIQTAKFSELGVRSRVSGSASPDVTFNHPHVPAHYAISYSTRHDNGPPGNSFKSCLSFRPRAAARSRQNLYALSNLI